jgi:glycerate 2-kinase
VPAASGPGGRSAALDLLQAALAAIEGRRSVREALAGEPLAGPVWVLAVGKAAASMTLGARDALGEALAHALVITKDGHVLEELRPVPGVTVLESAHPVPDARSLAAGERLLAWLAALPAQVSPLFLISGGASSLVEALEPGLTLGDLTRMTNEGLASGIDIGELNARRRRLSRIKGGRFTALLGTRPARALFISDVPGDDPAVIGSGLLGPAAEGADAVRRRIVGSIDIALSAAAGRAAALGFAAQVAPQRFAGDAEVLAGRLVRELAGSTVPVHLWGGESTVHLPPAPGRGGRNQHLALAAARLIAGTPVVLLAAGTDGTDGPTEEAGGLVDGGTLARLMRAGVDPAASLARADAGSALAASGDLITTGPTGTNAGDLCIALTGAPAHGGSRQPVL